MIHITLMNAIIIFIGLIFIPRITLGTLLIMSGHLILGILGIIWGVIYGISQYVK